MDTGNLLVNLNRLSVSFEEDQGYKYCSSIFFEDYSSELLVPLMEFMKKTALAENHSLLQISLIEGRTDGAGHVFGYRRCLSKLLPDARISDYNRKICAVESHELVFRPEQGGFVVDDNELETSTADRLHFRSLTEQDHSRPGRDAMRDRFWGLGRYYWDAELLTREQVIEAMTRRLAMGRS